jgi:hypothetical protein
MARFPSFFLLGAVAGLALWLVGAPTPFPVLGLVALVSGACGFAVSLVYVACYEPARWRSIGDVFRRAVPARRVTTSRATS